VLTVANFNMHCAMNGWGQPYDHVAAIGALDADVVMIEESWTAEGAAQGQAEVAADALGYRALTHTIGRGRRIRPQEPGNGHWVAQPAWSPQNRALYLDGVRPFPEKVRELPRYRDGEPGTFNIAMLVRPDLEIEGTRVVPMNVLRADRVERAALVVDLRVDGRPLSVVGTHMSHLLFGSHRNWAELRTALRTEARPDAVLAGDMNTWGPLVVYLFMRGWRRAVRGPTWPAWRPHSQIDHILVRGSVRPVTGAVLADAGSDHRPVRAAFDLGG
jgi:endonuclease/exonuclease/phosphatase family metal-dependent hydrolase